MLKSYVLSLIAAALVSGILLEGVGEGHSGKVMKRLCGLFLLLTALGPLGRLDLPDLGDFRAVWREEAQRFVDQGEAYAQVERNRGIEAQLSAYVLDKAAALDFPAKVRLMLSEEGLPEGVTLEASPTPAQKEAMEAFLKTELGIPEEAIGWVEP